MLDKHVFKNIVEYTNLIAFDFIIVNVEGEVLLLKRKNAPAQGFWFIPGGRIYKNERLNTAFDRILLSETGLNRNDCNTITHKGLYDHIYPDNYFNDERFNTHYIIYAMELKIKKNTWIQIDKQHSEFKYQEIKYILDNAAVHQFVKNYFVESPENKFAIW
jgi:colanic acid biosynthesis protein WcaH